MDLAGERRVQLLVDDNQGKGFAGIQGRVDGGLGIVGGGGERGVAKVSVLAVVVAIQAVGGLGIGRQNRVPGAVSPIVGQVHSLAPEDSQQIHLGQSARDMLARPEVVFRHGQLGARVSLGNAFE